MVGSAGPRQPAARRSQACRRACPADDAGVGAPAATHARLGGPANSLSAVRVRGRRAVVKDAGVRPPNDGQAAADDAPPRPPEDAAHSTISTDTRTTSVAFPAYFKCEYGLSK